MKCLFKMEITQLSLACGSELPQILEPGILIPILYLVAIAFHLLLLNN